MEFADEFNEYQQDSLALVDAEDIARTGQELTGRLVVDGLPTFDRDFRFGHPDTVRVLPSAARMQDLGSPLTVDAPFAPDSVAECRFIAAFQLAGGLFADTAP